MFDRHLFCLGLALVVMLGVLACVWVWAREWWAIVASVMSLVMSGYSIGRSADRDR